MHKLKRLSSLNPTFALFFFIIFSALINPSISLSYKMSMDLNGSDTLISSYSTDVGTCGCDIQPFSCDIFCCCDSSCSSVIILLTQYQVSIWSAKQLCSNSGSTLERSCDNLSSGGYWSFDDLACVYYSNRGNISYFYSYPDSGSVNYPVPDKLQHFFLSSVARTVEMQSINVASSTATTSPYSETQLLLKINKAQVNLRFMEIWAPIASGSCGAGYVNISSSQSFSCEYALDSTTCPLSTSLFTPLMIVCKNGECTDNIEFPAFASAASAASVCTNFATGQTIDITVSSSGKVYKIDAITIKLNQGDVDMTVHKKYQVKTTINVVVGTGSVSYSGNPGYQMNKPVIIQKSGAAYNIINIADASGNCVVNSNTNGISSLEIAFGQNAVYSCINQKPCESNLYIDQIARQPLTIRRWAKYSDNSTVQVSGTGSSVNTCTSQQIILNVIYTTGGWMEDGQSYIVGGQVTTAGASDSSWNRKYLKVNWIYVDPGTVSSPPENYFYQYFSYIWKPLRDYFGVY